jgi:hypothetical protein
MRDWQCLDCSSRFNPNFLMGSISNQFSLALCLIVVGVWISYCSKPNTGTAIIVGWD